MNYIQKLFEEQLSIVLDEFGNAFIGETEFSPIEILQADEYAYDDEFSKWLYSQWLPDQQETLNRILDINPNRYRFGKVCTSLENGQLIPFVGSGMSVPSGLPTWSEFLKKLGEFSKMAASELEEMIAEGAYEEIAERLALEMPDRLFKETIERELRIDHVEKILGPILFLPQLFNGIVLTTNMDNLLEEVYQQSDKGFQKTLLGSCIGDFREARSSSRTILLKIHGDHRDCTGRILRKSEYDEAYKPNSAFTEEIINIYRNHNLLYLGCSLNKDRTIQLLYELASSDHKMPKHYAFLRKLDDEANLAREHYLTERDIFPIWYEGDHNECIQALIVGMMKHMGRL